MFLATGQHGSTILAAAFHTLPIDSAARLKATAKFLDVTETTLKKWIDGTSTPPRAAVAALWHESHTGRAVTCAHSERGEQLYRALSRSLEDDCKRLRASIAKLNEELDRIKQGTANTPEAMNEPMYRRG